MFAQKPQNLRLIMRSKPLGKPTYLISHPQDSQGHDLQGQTENCHRPDQTRGNWEDVTIKCSVVS